MSDTTRMAPPTGGLGPESVTKADYVRLARFRSALRQFMRFSELRARAAGLTPQQHQMMLAIKGRPDRDWATVGELAEVLQVNHNAAVGLVRRAEEAGLVTRTPHPADRRSVCVGLTPKGEAMLAALSAEHKQELDRLIPAFADLLELD
ncbi:MAG: MarR family winged helix-turn-helix transcriptional regulator [Mycobacterium leprae]